MSFDFEVKFHRDNRPMKKIQANKIKVRIVKGHHLYKI